MSTPTPTPNPLKFSDNGYFSFTISNRSGDSKFDDAKYTQVFYNAFNKWESVIASKPYADWRLHVDVFYDILGATTLGSALALTFDTTDGTRNFGTCFMRTGRFTINSNWLESLINNVGVSNKSELENVSTHEIGHILGIGPFFRSSSINLKPISNYVDASDGSTKKYYTGANALARYKEYFPAQAAGIVGIPIEDDGGAGTEGGHPEEGIAGTVSSNDRFINGAFHPGVEHELMAGWSEGSNPMPLSKITIGFLEDFGFSVDYSKADYYDPSNPLAVNSPAPTPTLTTSSTPTPTASPSLTSSSTPTSSPTATDSPTATALPKACVVSASFSSELSGTYIENGTYNGKKTYKKDGAEYYLWHGDQGAGDRWHASSATGNNSGVWMASDASTHSSPWDADWISSSVTEGACPPPTPTASSTRTTLPTPTPAQSEPAEKLLLIKKTINQSGKTANEQSKKFAIDYLSNDSDAIFGSIKLPLSETLMSRERKDMPKLSSTSGYTLSSGSCTLGSPVKPADSVYNEVSPYGLYKKEIELAQEAWLAAVQAKAGNCFDNVQFEYLPWNKFIKEKGSYGGLSSALDAECNNDEAALVSASCTFSEYENKVKDVLSKDKYKSSNTTLIRGNNPKGSTSIKISGRELFPSDKELIGSIVKLWRFATPRIVSNLTLKSGASGVPGLPEFPANTSIEFTPVDLNDIYAACKGNPHLGYDPREYFHQAKDEGEQYWTFATLEDSKTWTNKEHDLILAIRLDVNDQKWYWEIKHKTSGNTFNLPKHKVNSTLPEQFTGTSVSYSDIGYFDPSEIHHDPYKTLNEFALSHNTPIFHTETHKVRSISKDSSGKFVLNLAGVLSEDFNSVEIMQPSNEGSYNGLFFRDNCYIESFAQNSQSTPDLIYFIKNEDDWTGINPIGFGGSLGNRPTGRNHRYYKYTKGVQTAALIGLRPATGPMFSHDALFDYWHKNFVSYFHGKFTGTRPYYICTNWRPKKTDQETNFHVDTCGPDQEKRVCIRYSYDRYKEYMEALLDRQPKEYGNNFSTTILHELFHAMSISHYATHDFQERHEGQGVLFNINYDSMNIRWQNIGGIMGLPYPHYLSFEDGQIGIGAPLVMPEWNSPYFNRTYSNSFSPFEKYVSAWYDKNNKWDKVRAIYDNGVWRNRNGATEPGWNARDILPDEMFGGSYDVLSCNCDNYT